MSKLLIVITGPTASGKTNLSLDLAREFGTEIISADSRQFFREMTIGTAKPSLEELSQAPHHFINSLSVADDYSAGDFERDALEKLNRIYIDNDTAIMVGGSGLYIDAVCNGLDEFPDIDPQIREDLQKTMENEGIQSLRAMLLEKDPEGYASMDQDNPRRLIRALEVCLGTNRPYSAFKKREPKTRPFKILKIGLEWERTTLYERINKRVDSMMLSGLLDEVEALIPIKKVNALQTVGYRELFDYFDKKHSLSEAVELIKRNTRRYAKRQMTWFRKDESIHWFHPRQKTEILTFIRQTLATD